MKIVVLFAKGKLFLDKHEKTTDKRDSSPRGPLMTDPSAHRLFTWIDRAFWLIWLGFMALVWTLVHEVQTAPERLEALAPDQAACLSELPLVVRFSAAGQAVFWTGFAIEIVLYAVLLALAHQVVHRCATGRVFVDGMIVSLRRIGWIIAGFPLIDLAIVNLSAWIYVRTGDVLAFTGSWTFDFPVLGVGLLLVTMAAAMRLAVRLHRDAELTI
jgi:hypothetical protein